jgi:hypothetical protein
MGACVVEQSGVRTGGAPNREHNQRGLGNNRKQFGVRGTWAANEHRHPPPARRIPPTAPACLVLPCVGCCAAGSTAVGVACGASERRPPMKSPLPFNSLCAGFRRSRRVRHVRGRGLVVYAPASSHGAAAVVGRGFYRRRRAPSRLAADLNGNQRRKYCKSTVQYSIRNLLSRSSSATKADCEMCVTENTVDLIYICL